MKRIILSLFALSSCAHLGRASVPSVEASSLRALWVHDGAFYAVGSGGVLYQPEGREPLWSAQETPTRVALHDVWGDDATLFAVGEDGAILRSEGGAWQTLESSTNKDLFSIWGDQQTLFIVGQRGLLLCSTDRGETWSQRQLSRESLRAVWSGMGHTIIVGDNGEIIHSADGGLTWVHESAFRRGLSGAMPVSLRAVYADETGIYAAGDLGTLLYRSWGEGVWRQQDSHTEEDLSSLWGDGHGNIFAVGDSGTLVRGSLGELTSTHLSGLGDLRDMWGAEDGAVFVLTGDGLLYKEGALTREVLITKTER